jgi:hypothetical protein
MPGLLLTMKRIQRYGVESGTSENNAKKPRFMLGFPAELVFNIDESGLSDWEEGKRKDVIVSTELELGDLHYGLDCAIRHQTLVCLISASGDVDCPFVISNDR